MAQIAALGGVELGVWFVLALPISFLIAAPTINEVAVILLFGLFGLKVAALYVASGLVVAIFAGYIIGRFKMERYVEDFVWKIPRQGEAADEKLTWPVRIERAWGSVKEIFKKVWLYVVIGIAVGAGIHGYVPEDALASNIIGFVNREGRGYFGIEENVSDQIWFYGFFATSIFMMP